jgi:hypothetical protein
MTRALRDALHAAADGEGCSLNAYALQILAAAAGDPARFRGAGDTVESVEQPRDMPRDEQGFPLRRLARDEHREARRAFFETMAAERGAAAADRLVRERDVTDPAFFVEWARSQSANAAAGSA